MLPLVLAAPASGAAAAAVPIGQQEAPPDEDAAAHLRSGIVVGLGLGGGFAGASGYPNSSSDIGNPAFFSSSGFMAGASGTFFVMGALSDYLNFGFWAGSASFRNGDWQSSGGGGGLRVEAFPLVGLVPALGGLGFLGNFGIGSGSLTDVDTKRQVSSGTQAYVGGGAFYEWAFGHLFGGHFALGPSLEYDAIFSTAFERHGVDASLRIVFYGGP